MQKSRNTAQILSAAGLLALTCMQFPQFALAQFRSDYAHTSGMGNAQRTRPVNSGAQVALPGGVYPQFRSNFGSIRWLKEQMPLKVYISPGLTLDEIIDPMGAPIANVDNRDHWPDIVASIIQDQQRFGSLPRAKGFALQHVQAAAQGIGEWKALEKEGVVSFVITNDPSDADIYVFWTNHFTDKLGMGLFQNDIRGYTAKRSFPYKAIQAGQRADFKPVVVLLRTIDSAGNPMGMERMKASAAHEFGHALGIEGHSTNPNDLMSSNYGHGTISQSDAATLRYLYHLTPDLIP